MARKKSKSKNKSSANPTPRRPPKRLSPKPQSQPRPQGRDVVITKFSLADEVRWMSHNRSTAFDSSKKLRNMPISFVSAGYMEGTIKETASQAELLQRPQHTPATPPSPLNPETLAQLTIRSPTPSPSISSNSDRSSDEIVVFRGRGHRSLAHFNSSAPSVPSITATAGSASTLLAHRDSSPLSSEAARFLSTEIATQAESDIDSETNSVAQSHFEKRRGGRPIWEGRTTPWVSRSKPGIGWRAVEEQSEMDAFLRNDMDPKDAALNDYMQNIEEFGLKDEVVASASFAHREMDLDAGSHNDWESGPEQSPNLDDKGWNSDTMRDLDGMSTSSDVVEVVARIFNKRIRATGVQYLVLYEGYTLDDVRWLPSNYLTTPSDLELIRKFEAKLVMHPEPVSSSNSSSELEVYKDEDESSDEEELDDETIARVLQKQEELGLGSNELLLHAADEYFNNPTNIDMKASSIAYDQPNKKRQHRFGSGNRMEPAFPSAAAMADAFDMDPYGAFDIMDTERPSLRPRKKGRRGQIPLEFEDSHLNDSLHASWEADRVKKRLKKAEREELRKQGLLGRKGKAPDLSVKYRDGYNMIMIVEEIRSFMESSMQTLSLPPMEAHRRALIHQFVSHLGLGSKSRGIGANRFTVLSKTRRTVAYDEEGFDKLLEQKQFNKRMQIYAGAPGYKGRKGPKTHPTVGYKDGDVVGASAPELGPENRGRTLLEKMGWSKGMALGAHDNKGILQPIPHTVKTNKAGLR